MWSISGSSRQSTTTSRWWCRGLFRRCPRTTSEGQNPGRFACVVKDVIEESYASMIRIAHDSGEWKNGGLRNGRRNQPVE